MIETVTAPTRGELLVKIGQQCRLYEEITGLGSLPCDRHPGSSCATCGGSGRRHYEGV